VHEALRASRNGPVSDRRRGHPTQHDAHRQAKHTYIACHTYTRLTIMGPYRSYPQVERLLVEGCSRRELGDYVSERGKKRFWDHFPE